MMTKLKMIAGLCAVMAVSAGCTTTERTVGGGLIGGAGGAIVGDAVGGSTGAIVGGVAGGTAGAIVGNRSGRRY